MLRHILYSEIYFRSLRELFFLPCRKDLSPATTSTRAVAVAKAYRCGCAFADVGADAQGAGLSSDTSTLTPVKATTAMTILWGGINVSVGRNDFMYRGSVGR